MTSLKTQVATSARLHAESFTSRPSWFIDKKNRDYCEVCRRETGNTVAATCLRCATNVINDRRFRFPRSEGNRYMRRFGFKNYFAAPIRRQRERVRTV